MLFSGWWGIDGIWIAAPVSDLISTCVVFVFYIIERKKLKILEASMV